jgi:hypothetical protein
MHAGEVSVRLSVRVFDAIEHFIQMHSRFTFGVLTVLSFAVMAVTAAIGIVLIPESFQNQKFWLSLGAVLFSEFLCWLFFAVIPAPRGEQTRGLFEGGATIASGVYLAFTLVLAVVAVLGFSFKFLVILHLVAFLSFLLIAGLFLLGGEATKRADEGK